MSENPKVSIIIPVYNTEKYLRKCLDSIVNQTLKDIEIICVNDGSTDGSLAILEEYATKDLRIKVISAPNRGVYAARNTALRISCGKYIYFCDSDDFIEHCAMEELYDLAINEDLEVVYFEADVIEDVNMKGIQHIFLPNHYQRTLDACSGLSGLDFASKCYENREKFASAICMQIYRKKFLDENQITFYEGVIHTDTLFNYIVAICAKKVAYVKKNYFHRRVRIGSISTDSQPITHFIGIYTCFYELFVYLQDKTFEKKEHYLVANRFLLGLLQNCRNHYRNLDLASAEYIKFLFAQSPTSSFMLTNVIPNSPVFVSKNMNEIDISAKTLVWMMVEKNKRKVNEIITRNRKGE